MGKLEKIMQYADRVIGFLVIAALSIMLISCVLQVFTRYVLNNSLSWTEELARYSFIWANLLGASLCLKKNSHAQVTVIFDALPATAQKIMRLIIQFLVITMSGYMIVQGLKVMEIVQGQLSPALKMPSSLLYLAVPLGGLFLIIYAFFNIVAGIKAFKEKEEIR
jgi:TRAP-type C4-dicarboxylate transport system permease small subunit